MESTMTHQQQRINDRISLIHSDEATSMSTTAAAKAKAQASALKKHQQQKHSHPRKTILTHYHSALLTITNTFIAVFFKSFPAFIPFVIANYGYSYSFVTLAFAIGSISTMSCIFILPPLLNLRANTACFLECMFTCAGGAILWLFRDSQVLFVVGVSLVFNGFQLQWGTSNAIISAFVSPTDKHLSHSYLSSLSAGWTYATFLFIAVGFLLKFESFWAYLLSMMALLILLALLNLCILPKVSVNAFNAFHTNSNSNASSVVSSAESNSRHKVSMMGDFRILFSLRVYRVLLFNLALTFTAWAFYYTSFSQWIKHMYGLNQGELGIDAALIEGIGNVLAIMTISHLTTTEDLQNSRKLRLEKMMVYFALILLVSVGAMAAINFVSVLEPLLSNKIVVYALISGYLCGSEGVIIGSMILSVTETPPSQQARSSALISVTNSICNFVGQLLVGVVYTAGGFRMETPILLAIQVMVVAATIYLGHAMRANRMHSELIWINEHAHVNAKYTT